MNVQKKFMLIIDSIVWQLAYCLFLYIVERPTVDVGTISEMGNTVTIHCNASVSQGSPALTDIYWLVNNVNLSLTDNNKYSGGNLNTPSLTINNIASSDIGEYRCVATNLVGSTTSSQFISLGKIILIQWNS